MSVSQALNEYEVRRTAYDKASYAFQGVARAYKAQLAAYSVAKKVCQPIEFQNFAVHFILHF